MLAAIKTEQNPSQALRQQESPGMASGSQHQPGGHYRNLQG